VRGGARDRECHGRSLRLARVDRGIGFRRLRDRRREVLAERTIRLVGARAILSGRGLDMRVRTRAHRVALETRVREGDHRWQQELEQQGHVGQRARERRRSAHVRTLRGLTDGRHGHPALVFRIGSFQRPVTPRRSAVDA